MELQALLVLCGLGVVGVAVILLMGLFSASGTTYEEAIAQQRKATTELLALAENKGKAKKTSKKANKKLAKKERKESAAAATGSEPESEAPAESGADEETPAPKPHVEFSPPVVVDVPTDTPPNIKIRKRGKDPKVKPILVNKEDPSCVSDPGSVPFPGSAVSNHFEEMHPKDEFELLHSSFLEKALEKKEDAGEKKDKASKPTKNTKASSKPAANPESVKDEAVPERQNTAEGPKEQRKVKKVEKKNVVEEVSVAEEVVPPLNAPQPSELTTDKLLKQALAPVATAPAVAPAPSPPAGKGKKKKPEPNVLSLMAGDSGGVAVSELVRVVREAALSRNEIQILTDALLNKHHDPLPEHSEWTEGPNDPMQKLKKQLAEKEKALADEVEASQALHAKLKELRATLNSERGRYTAAARAAEQTAIASRAELHTLQTRLQRVLDDNHTLSQEKIHLQSKLAAEGEAQAQRVQMEMHIQRLSESEAGLVQQLTAQQAELNTLARDAAAGAAARDALILAQRHADELGQQLQEANHAYAELEQQRQRAVQAEKAAQQELRDAQDRLAEVSDLQNEVERLTSRAQTAEGNVENLKADIEKAKEDAEQAKVSVEKAKEDADTYKKEAERAKEEAKNVTEEANKLREEMEKLKQQIEIVRQESEKQKSQLSNEVASLKEQLSLRESELAEVKQMTAAPPHPAHNGLPNSNDDQKVSASELAKVESVVEALKEELTSALSGSKELKEQVATLREQLQQYQQKNNELRTKNWKVMEALQSAEKALQAKCARAMPAQDTLSEAIVKAQESQYNEVASILRSAVPNIAPGSGTGHDWLQAFANNLKNEFQKIESQKKELEKKQRELEKTEVQAPAVDSRLTEVIAQTEQLQTLLHKYKQVIADTESALSHLQQNVSVEEQRWQNQLAEKQREVDALQQRIAAQEEMAFAYSCIEKSLPTIMQEMQKKADKADVILSQAQKPNHSHSFADTERLTEERLMGSLSEKLDSRNGPLQVNMNV
ncbi:PREDICTED: ribosome-binding protein 1 [Papilio xuthus]|uniref:Ribosome-binding protein 1 n=1 Tax=Papilio xuthus TaxID=66420 RepID=A0AAJ7EBC5_PAPXU|nr:PREDICTED: ribosome-binding protein 1 [Papilio xuthus]